MSSLFLAPDSNPTLEQAPWYAIPGRIPEHVFFAALAESGEQVSVHWDSALVNDLVALQSDDHVEVLLLQMMACVFDLDVQGAAPSIFAESYPRGRDL